MRWSAPEAKVQTTEVRGPGLGDPGALLRRFPEFHRVQGWMTLEETGLLFQLARWSAEGCVVQVGAYRGQSIIALALGTLAGHRCPLYVVSGRTSGPGGPLDRVAFLENILAAECAEQVRILNIACASLRGPWPEAVQLLWLHGDRGYDAICRDYHVWRERLAPGALVVLDAHPDQVCGASRLRDELVERRELVPFVAHGRVHALQWMGQ